MPKTAFLVLKSPQELDPTHSMKRFADREDASVILVEDGVYHAVIAQSAEKLGKSAHEVLVSQDDLDARGFSASDLRVGKVADYPGMIDCIMERTERTITL
jgi:sulfur relay protein TusB/DsrH